MKDIEKTYKQLVIMLKGDVKRLEVDLEKQTFYKDVAGESRIKNTKRTIELKFLEIEAIEKQIAKKPDQEIYIYNYIDDYDDGVSHLCPDCNGQVGLFSNEEEDWIFKRKYCEDCGQKIGWD